MGGFHHASPLVDSVITCHIRSSIIPASCLSHWGKKAGRGMTKIVAYATIKMKFDLQARVNLPFSNV